MQQPIQEQPGMHQGYDPGSYPPPQGGYALQQGYPQPVVSSQTVIVTTQPQQRVALRGWSSGMLDCFNDFSSCLMGWFCPCILLCQLSSRMGEGCCFATCCPNALLSLRIKLRSDNHIEGNLCNDHCVTACCGVCVLCQMSRELDHVATYSQY